jgi:carboxylesterase
VWLILGLASAASLALFRGWNLEHLTSHPHPARDYGDAVRRIQALRAQEPPGMNPVCHLLFMTHGQKTERAIVLVHGYTNCPQQFRALGERLYDLGYNVLIPPLPRHGLADRATRELRRLTAEELATYGDEVIDIAQGLGEQVTLLGFSAGGVVAAWASQHRRDIHLGVIISPGFGVTQIPTRLITPAVNLLTRLPDFYLWWDPTLRDASGLPHAYAGYSTRGIAQVMRLGLAARAEAERTPPAARSILVITNAGDRTVDNALVYQVTATWRKQGANLRTYEFAADLRLEHDFIDPGQPYQRVEVVYSVLVDLIAKSR